MSFASLRDQRRAKDAKSLLKSTGSAPQNHVARRNGWPVVPNDPYELSESLEIRKSPSAGRTLFSRTLFNPGSVVLSCRPHVHVISNSRISSHCATCCTEVSETVSLKRCSKCAVAYYCSTACQNADWPMHKPECVSLRDWAKSAPDPGVAIPGEAVRCLGRVLRLREREGYASKWTKQMSSMQSLRQNLPSSAAESHTHIAHALVRYLGISGPEGLNKYGITSAGDLVDIVSQFTTNSFTLSSSSLSPIGVCISPTVALANHSCDPNAVVVFPRPSGTTLQEPVMQIIAFKNISPGEEILTSYVDTSQPRHLRRQDLRETYGFTCACDLCEGRDNNADADPRYCVWCPKECGGKCSLAELDDQQLECFRCQAKYEATAQEEVLDRVRLATEALEKATQLELSDPARALRMTTNMLALVNMPYSSHPLLGLLRLHVALLITSLSSSSTPSDRTLTEAITTGFRVQHGLHDVLPAGHPVRGISLFELGKLLAMDPPPGEEDHREAEMIPPHGPQRLALAMSTLVQAREELRVGFGASGELVGQVDALLKELEREVQVWRQGVRNVLQTGSIISST
ncbi:SET domain-containing protein [Exidia glandulosa HHB12029]|uniref:SET domain-containing protein n=1 Tax=Exidia glandulosa HHB12029 TaxID=1314781 RepID=A0A165I785_EXIGL|nr:SET domain-containing protein [Exidia glandulosa HHB12029]